MKSLIVTIIAFLSLVFTGFSQYDTLHYIPPVFVSDAIKNTAQSCRDHFLILSTNESTTFQVTIRRGDGALFSAYTILDGTQVSTGVFNLSRTNSIKLRFTGTGVGAENIMSQDSLNFALITGGYKLTAPRRFFANIRHISNAQAASLTSKGTTALGTTFYVGFQAAGFGTNNAVDNTHSNFISVMATEDNTNVTINNFRSGVTLIGQPSSGVPATANAITFTLNEGQSYIVAQIKSNMTTDMNAYNGIRVTSNRDVVVNSGCWTGPADNGGSRDIGIDQLIPSKFAGEKYGIASGNGSTVTAGSVEKVIVISTRPGVTTINSGAGGTVTLNGQGDYAILTGPAFWSNATPISVGSQAHFNMALVSNQPILVYQTLFGSTSIATSSMNLIPPLADCIGSDSIYIHDPSQFGSASSISITSPITATVNVRNQTGALLFTVPPTPENLPGTLITDFNTTVYAIPAGVTGLLITADEKITLGFLGASGVVGGGGFMSAFSDRNVDYQASNPLFIGNGQVRLDLCEENPTFLTLTDSSVYTTFQWFRNDIALPGQTNGRLFVNAPGDYNVIAEYCSLPLESPVIQVDEFGSPGEQGFSKISALHEVETFDGFPNNSIIGTWDDQSKAFNNAVGPANRPRIFTNDLNKPGFHPLANFNAANSQYLKTEEIVQNLNGNSRYTFFLIVKDSNSAQNAAVISLDNTANGTKIVKQTTGYRFQKGGSPSFSINVSVATNVYNIITVVSNGTRVEIYANGRRGTAATLPSAAINVISEMLIGSNLEGGSIFFNGFIGEILLLDTTLSAVERQITETYYAVKYGITLDPTDDEVGIMDGNYVSNNGAVVWNYDLNTDFHNAVSGIAFDACGRLRQWQNKAANEADVVAIGLGLIAPTALSNPNRFTVDNTYFMWGNNARPFDSQGETDFGPTVNGELIQTRVARVWKAQETGTPGSVRVQFNLAAGGNGTTIYDLAQTRLLIDVNGIFATGARSIAPTSFNNSTGIVSFDYDFIASSGFFFTLGSVNSIITPLPITLVDFKAEKVDLNQVECSWLTASEINNDFFTVEKSIDGQNWFFVTNKTGAGNSNQPIGYSIRDPKPFAGLSYYRLSQTDFDGVRTNVGVRSINFENIYNSLITLFPNPATTSLKIQADRTLTGTLSIVNGLGQLVRQVDILEENEMSFDLVGLSQGVYYLRVSTSEVQENIKFIIR